MFKYARGSKLGILLAAGFLVTLSAQAATYNLTVVQFNLWNKNFTPPSLGFCADKSTRGTCERAYQIIDFLNGGPGYRPGTTPAADSQYDIIMTEENSTMYPDSPPINLLTDFKENKLKDTKYALCGKINSGTVYYNKNRWKVNAVEYYDVTYNEGGGGSGARQITVCILEPNNPAQPSPWIIAAATHWCIDWTSGSIRSNCVGGNPPAAHLKDVDTFKTNIDHVMAQHSQAAVILGGDLNSMGNGDYKALVEKMKSNTLNNTNSSNFIFLTSNPYKDQASNNPYKEQAGTPLQDTYPVPPGVNIVIDYIFYNPKSANLMTTIKPLESKLDPFNNLSDHLGAVVTKFQVTTP